MLTSGGPRASELPALPYSLSPVPDLTTPFCSVGWGFSVAVSCGIGHRCGSHPALLWLWHRLAVVFLIRFLAWELPCVTGSALRSQKQTKKAPTPQNNPLPCLIPMSLCALPCLAPSNPCPPPPRPRSLSPISECPPPLTPGGPVSRNQSPYLVRPYGFPHLTSPQVPGLLPQGRGHLEQDKGAGVFCPLPGSLLLPDWAAPFVLGPQPTSLPLDFSHRALQ